MAPRVKSEEGGNQPASLAEVAATLITGTDDAQASEETDENQEADLDVSDGTEEEDPTGGDNDEETTSELEEDEGNDEQEDDQSTGEDEDDVDPEYFDINDDDLISVMVDGEEQEVSIGDLKKAHSLSGATEKRLQEATELRKTAHAERTQMLEKLAEEERVLTETLSGLDDSVFAPVIPEPTAELRRSNPEQYLRHKEAYDADQTRISDAKNAVQTRLDEIKQTRADRLAEYSKAAGQVILQEIPELADEKKAPAVLQSLAETAKFYGYTDDEIRTALDPRMFMLVRDAMRYRQMTDKSRERPMTEIMEGQKTKKVRRLRSGNTLAKNRARHADKKRTAAVDKARASGKPQDVAATLLVPKG